MTPVLPNSGEAAFPSDDMIVLAALLEGGEWREAEDIASTLRRLGFVISPQRMVGQLKRLGREDMPIFQGRRDDGSPLKQYRVTRFGHTQLTNRFIAAYGLRPRPNTRGGG